jgi:hypothetical protein
MHLALFSSASIRFLDRRLDELSVRGSFPGEALTKSTPFRPRLRNTLSVSFSSAF